MEWVAAHATTEPVTVLDIGGRDINGSPRDLFPNAAEYTVLDIAASGNVDIVADAATWTPDREYDVIVCTEVLEHTPDWVSILNTAHKACRDGGRLIVTCAGPGRPEHSGIDGRARLQAGEWYQNIDPERLRDALEAIGWQQVTAEFRRSPNDTRATAVKGPK
jgi:SAM-dependent methyltransferase